MKKLTVLATAVAAAFSGTATAAPIFNPATGSFYEFIQRGVDFDTALVDAATATAIAGYTAHLATVTSSAEKAFIVKNVTTQAAWIAGSDAGTEGRWTWIAGPETGQVFWQNGVTITFDDFIVGEPNNYLGRNETGLTMNWDESGGWNDSQTMEKFGYIVEYSQNVVAAAVPEPGTWLMMITGFLAVGGALRRRVEANVQFS